MIFDEICILNILGKRKLSENQSSEQEVKRLSSGEEKSGQTIMRGQSQSQVQGQGLPNVRSQVGAQQGTDEGQQIRDEINMRTGGPPGQPQASETQDRQEAQKCKEMFPCFSAQTAYMF